MGEEGERMVKMGVVVVWEKGVVCTSWDVVGKVACEGCYIKSSERLSKNYIETECTNNQFKRNTPHIFV